METPNKQFNWADYFSFKSMIALRIIQLIYLIGAAGTTLTGVAWLFTGMGMGAGGRFIGLAIIVFGNILWRVWCELLIIFFRINETMNGIELNTKKSLQIVA
jgi:hypothetical protein